MTDSSKKNDNNQDDVAFIAALAELLRAQDLSEIEVSRATGKDTGLEVRLVRHSAAPVPQAAPAPALAPAPLAVPAAPAAAQPAAPAAPADDPAQHPPGAVTRRWWAPPICSPSPERLPS